MEGVHLTEMISTAAIDRSLPATRGQRLATNLVTDFDPEGIRPRIG
jgi:hypothetical protein